MFEYELPTNKLIARRLHYLIQTEYDGSYQHLYVKLKEEAPNEIQLRMFKRFIDNGVMTDSFFRTLAAKTKIGQVSFGRFFDLHVDNADLFGD